MNIHCQNTVRFLTVLVIALSPALLLCGCGKSTNSSGSSSTSKSSSRTSAGGGKKADKKKPIDPATTGVIEGEITFTGKPPRMQRIDMGGDSTCAAAHTKPARVEEVVLSRGGGLRNVVVFIAEGAEQWDVATSKEPVLLQQVGCQYVPHVLSVMVDQPIEIRNGDETLHNVHAHPEKNKPFNFGQPRKGMTATKTFTRPELDVPIKCDVHPWMLAYAHVFDHPFHAVSGEGGQFRIEGVPPGEYVVEVHHEKLGSQRYSVTVGERETVPLSINMPAESADKP